MLNFRTATATATAAILLGLTEAARGLDQPESSVTPTPPAASPAPMTTPGLLDGEPLEAGRFEWYPQRSPRGPVVVVVSIPEQRAHVYRNDIEIGVTTVSTGRPGHATPTGVFTILQKQVKHESTIYNNAPMPYMERLTWDGIAMHAGNLPGYPASHGCVRMPLEFSHLLYGVTSDGGTVIIADEKSPQAMDVHPGALLAARAPVAGEAPFEWSPGTSPDGPFSIVLSSADRLLFVYRNGIEIGSAIVEIVPPNTPLGSRVYTVLDGSSDEPNVWVPGQPMPRWQAVSLNGFRGDPADLSRRVRVDPAFAKNLFSVIGPGTTIFVTDAAAQPATRTEPGFTVLSGEPESQASSKSR